MSRAANPNKPKQSKAETEAAVAAKQQKAERDKIRRLIITLGDENKKVISQVRGLAGALEDDIDLHGELMCQTVLDCAGSLPLKSSMYAAWLAKMAEKSAKFAADAVSKVMEELRASIRSGKIRHAQTLLRFLVALGNTGVLRLESVLKLLQEVLALSEGLKAKNGGDVGIFLALAQLPFLSPAAYKQAKGSVDELIEAAQPYLASRAAAWKPLLHILKGQDLPDRLEALVSALKTMAQSDWLSQAVMHVPSFEPSLTGKPDMPDISLDVKADEIKKNKVRLQVPLAVANLITSKLDDSPQMSEADRWVLEDYLLMTMEMFAQDVEECSKQILKIPVLHPHFEAVAVETIVCQMLRLPAPVMLPLFYSRLLEAIAEKQESVKKLVEKAYEALFEKLSDLDEDCLDVLAEAFAYHLVHCAYQADWKHFTGENLSVQGQRFIRRTLERLQRLSFHQNLIHRLPEAVHVYVPQEPAAASGLPVVKKPEFGRMLGFIRIKDAKVDKALEYCDWLMKPVDADIDESDAKRRKLNDGSAEAKQAAASASEELSKEASSAAPAEEEEQKADVEAKKQHLQKLLEEEFGAQPAEPWVLEDVAELVAFVMLQNGLQTPSHMNKLLDGNHQILLKLRPTDEAQAHGFAKKVARCVFDFWKFSAQRLEIVMDAFVQRGVVTPRAVVEAALADGGMQGCDSMPVWNVVHAVARKSLERSQSVHVELMLAKKLGKDDAIETSCKQLEEAIHENAELFSLIFTTLVKNYQGFENRDPLYRQITLKRIESIGRKYLAGIRPLVDAAESRIPGVAQLPEISAVFNTLSTLP